MKCWVCESDSWYLFSKEFTGWPESNLGICKECGAVAYQVDPASEEKIREYYRKEYRGNIGPTNLLTTSRKLNYMRSFIDEWITEREKSGKKLTVGDIGCATGYLVDWFRNRGHKATGSEWTITMRRFANNFYGIPITEDITEKHRYDLLTMYHTLEHFIEPDKKLAKYKSLLTEDGHMVISVPEWLNVLDEPGVGKVTEFKSLFHKDHINVFSDTSLKNVFKKVGLEIVKEDHITYGQTYLLKKCEPTTEYVKQDWQKVKEIIEKQHKAIGFYQQALQGKEGAFRDAIETWQKFPDAYYDWILNSTQKKDRGRCAELIQEAVEAMPGYVKVHIMRGYFLYQNEQWQSALDDFNYLVKVKVNEDLLMYKGYCHYHLGQLGEAMSAFNSAATLNPQKWTEAMVWLCKCATEGKAWDEIAMEEVKNQLLKQANVKLEPKDPAFAIELNKE